jgi:predicted Rossmann fold nucleotide-binding protein DprA/Smf involved in DNA uptake
MEATYLGNKAILKIKKTAFLCSRKVTSGAVMKCYDWATEMRDKGVCVISGFHSMIEKDVLHFLLKGKQPIILVIGRAMYRSKLPEELQKAIDEKRLLIISPVVQTLMRNTKESALIRNKYITEQAEKIVFGCINPESSLWPLMEAAQKEGKEVEVL